jgi:hypothetical protein
MIDTSVTNPDQDAVGQDHASSRRHGQRRPREVNFTERYSEILGKVNNTLDQVDWSQMGRIGKVLGICWP